MKLTKQQIKQEIKLLQLMNSKKNKYKRIKQAKQQEYQELRQKREIALYIKRKQKERKLSNKILMFFFNKFAYQKTC